MSTRRQFIALLGSAAAAWPLAAPAQQPRHVAVLLAGYSPGDREGQAAITVFHGTLQRLGWVDGRNVRLEYRLEAGDAGRTKSSAAEFVRSMPDVIVGTGNEAVAELQQLTRTIPIVFTRVGDPVGSGFAAGLAKPGGNMTGFQTYEPPMGGKWLGLLREAAPNINRVAVLFDSDSIANVAFLRTAETVARSLGVNVTAFDIHDGIDDGAISTFASQPDGGLLVLPHEKTTANRGLIIILAARYRIPAIYPFRYFAAEGGLLSYSNDQVEEWRIPAIYVDRILRGEKPGNLPVQAATKFELVVNLKTAKALGLNIPPGLPLLADEVIE